MTHSAESSGAASLWSTFELSLAGPADGNPFRDIELRAVFTQGEREVRVNGFYDGNGTYRLRFLPDTTGTWSYRTRSNAPALDGVSGSVEVGPALPGRHGPVKVANRHHFAYVDGTRYINLGTTAYVWNLQGDALEEETLATLAAAPFTKIRMCVFPKHYRYNENEPERYPFRLLQRGSSDWDGSFSGADKAGWRFDLDVFEPDSLRHNPLQNQWLGTPYFRGLPRRIGSQPRRDHVSDYPSIGRWTSRSTSQCTSGAGGAPGGGP